MDLLDWARLLGLGFAAGMAGGLERDGLLMGAVADRRAARRCAGECVSERVLEISLAAVQLVFAWRLAKKPGLR